jgi:hypothetical protein
LLLLQSDGYMGFLIEKTMFSWYHHVALVLRFDGEPGAPLRVVDVEIPAVFTTHTPQEPQLL